ncbi:hypothetical protein BGM30_32250 [Microcystis aeruginosa NIES-298]|uniref:Uncharacterized protein n=7 Tax=Microcystis TaxID=1125 RepID=A0A9P3DGE8_MICAE|nr:hypothetical protein myaer102_14490 [Microcystis viridis NIES-102]GBD54132.1 hypothetical protein BGM30_32250 [Microcystis aeruginosa NIES-298]CCI08843.1 hypothetical protein MICAD_3540006 [Microcystis aeruginosa PCC 7941]
MGAVEKVMALMGDFLQDLQKSLINNYTLTYKGTKEIFCCIEDDNFLYIAKPSPLASLGLG